MDKTFYRLDSKGKTIVWRVKVTKNLIETWDGDLGGKLTYNEDTVKEGVNIGKSNETTPAEQAMSIAERKIELKQRKGYTENINELETPVTDEEFFNNPPRSFVGPKPLASMPIELRDQLEQEGRLRYTQKFNGMCVNIVKGETFKIFSSSMDDRTLWFPEQIKELNQLNIPKGTWIVAEAEINSNPDLMKEVFSSDYEKGVERQKDIGQAKFRFFNLIFYRDTLATDMTWDERRKLLSKFASICKLCLPVIVLTKNSKLAEDLLTDNPSWEGLVIWDGECQDIPIKYGGSPSRDGGAWKLKNFKEADVLIVAWEKGRGKLNNDVATLTYGAYDDNGDIVEMGKGGSGLDETLRKEIKKAKLPLVAEVKYEEITSGGKFRLPVILRTRIDKSPKECLRKDIK